MRQTTTKSVEIMAQNLLIDLGTSPSLLGFYYVIRAITLIYENPEYRHQITKKLYPEVAKLENSTSRRVERAIRHAIDTTWSRGGIETLTSMFGGVVPKGVKPTNSEFISVLSLRIEQSLSEV